MRRGLNVQFGSLIGHGLPMRRLIETGACRGDRLLQLGLRGVLAGAGDAGVDGRAGHALVRDARDRAPRPRPLPGGGVRHRDRGLRRRLRLGGHRRHRPGLGPGTGTPEPGGFTPLELLDTIRRIAIELPVVGMDVVEVSPPYDTSDVTAFLANRVVLEMLSGIAYRRKGGRWGDIPATLLEGRR
jgi:Arginase family